MRIIGGQYKGRKLSPPKNLPVRPTTDFAREGLFNILCNRLDLSGMRMLDLFSGTGLISMEFISRGGRESTAVDINWKCVCFIKKTIRDLKISKIKPVRSEVKSFCHKTRNEYDIIFADPPYHWNEISNLPDYILGNGLISDNGLMIIEHSGYVDFNDSKHAVELRTFRNVHFSIFDCKLMKTCKQPL